MSVAEIDEGVFEATATIDNGSFGTRTVEAFVLDTTAALYGQHVAVDFVARIRGQKKFADVDDLIAAMGRDTDKARSILAAQS